MGQGHNTRIFPVRGIRASPVLPGLNTHPHSMEVVLEAGAGAGWWRRARAECAGAGWARAAGGARGGARGRPASECEPAAGAVFEDDARYLRSLDPRAWRDQDHYAVLGVRHLRYRASDDDIKRAYRQKVLKHHPDKRKGKGEEIRSEDDYFTCITKAYEILGTPSKRRAYDSVDPEFDDAIPTLNEIKRDGFFKAFTKCFEANARWSEKKNVPQLGDENTPREQVERFYAFWYDFESWREYSYQDEEEKEKGQDREERRWIEKQNKAARAKKKKEEMARIRTLVDLAYSNDLRIAKFKQEDKDKKLAAKRARQDAVQAKKAEEERLVREAQLVKQKADEAERAKLDAVRAERDQQKKSLRKERKTLRDLCKTNNFYAEDQDEAVTHMAALEKICEMLKLVELQDFMKELETNGKESFVKTMKETEDKLEAERRALFDTPKVETQKVIKKELSIRGPIEWTPEQMQLLIKAVNLFPAGTNQRWEVVANFINQHGIFADERRFTAKDVLAKAKDLQSGDFSKSSLKKAANQEAFHQFEKETKKSVATVDNGGISKSDNVPMVNGTGGVNGKRTESKIKENGDVTEQKREKEEVSWSKTEQELLEQAIKTFPASTPERWDRIAECIPNRSKRDCMKRFKELVDLVKAKKQAANIGK